jgi:hypothetical protein
MTDDELERALFALPLEDPPPDLHARILAATINRPQLTFRAWEVWAVGTLVAFMVWLAFLVATSVPDFGGTIARAISYGVDRLADSVSPTALLWMALGVSLVIWLPALSVPTSGSKIAGR